jgi:hypothetical protein
MSVASASTLRTSLLVMSVIALLFLTFKHLRRHIAERLRKLARYEAPGMKPN